MESKMEGLKRLRGNKKIYISKQVTNLKDRLAGKEQYDGLKEKIEVLNESFVDAKELNDEILKEESEKEAADDWIKEVEKIVENIIEETNAYFETIVAKEMVEKETSLSDSKVGDAEMNLKVNAIEKRLSGIHEEIKKVHL